MFYISVIEWAWELEIQTLCLGLVYRTSMREIEERVDLMELK